MVVNAFVSRSLFLVLPILIFLDVRSNNSLLLIILLFFLFFGTFVGNTWTALMKEVVPFDLRGKYFGIRNIFFFNRRYGYVIFVHKITRTS